MKDKRLERRYYKGIVKTITTYFLACMFIFLFNTCAEGKLISLSNAVFSILDFSAIKYAWYIEMYIGLFIMIPFLNILYHGLKSQNEKICLIVTALCLTSLPGILNVYEWSSVDWWIMPSLSDKYCQLIPDWWTGFYPITIYFMGCYLGEYSLKININKTLFCLVASVGGVEIYNYYRSYGNWYVGENGRKTVRY